MPHLLTDVSGPVATATLNRPEARHALSIEMRAGLRAFLARVAADDAVRCVVLCGSGGHFMGGGDLQVFRKAVQEMPEAERVAFFQDRVNGLQPLVDAMRRLQKPIVAKVAGACAGVGLSLVLACDLAIAAEDAFFTAGYVNIGTSPDGGLTYLLARRVGLTRAMEIALLGERIGAAQAKDWGLVNRVVPAADLDAEATALAERLAAGATLAIGRTKTLLYQGADSVLEQQMAREREAFAASTATADWCEGVTAFFEKRKPRFTGR